MPRRIFATSNNSSNRDQRGVNVSNADRVIDRFIPRASSQQTYRALTRSNDDQNSSDSQVDPFTTSGNSTTGDVNFNLRNEHIMARPVATISDGELFATQMEASSNSTFNSGFQHNGSMAEALGFFEEHSRVFNYGDTTSSRSASQLREMSRRDHSPKKAADSKKKKEIKIITPFRVLDAQRLRDDFYSNLISWSRETGNIIVGLDTRVFIWSETKEPFPLETVSDELITCVSFSNEKYLAVGTQNGRLLLYEQTSTSYLAAAFSERSLCCITWLEDSSGFFAGNDAGQVSYYELRGTEQGVAILRVCSFKYHYQQICGISISNDMKQIAVGCNDNRCSIWDISTKAEPKLKFMLPHNAAVKAIAYCPWSTALLATGGGSRDRTIRFWHSKTGTLLSSQVTKGQITSLIWSPNKKQISATFGFIDNDPVLITVYSYPRMEVLIQVKGPETQRALSGVASPDGNSICVAVSDESVRFYKLWSDKDHTLSPDLQEKGIFGSELLEMSEEVMRAPLFLR